MVNHQFGQSNEPFWYPQLPEGYSNNERHHQGGPIPSPGYGSAPGHHAPSQNFHGGSMEFRPPFGSPSFGFPGFPGFPGQNSGSHFPPNQQHGGNAAPQGPPPNWTPEYPSAQTFAIDPGAISRCMYRFTYVWLSRRQGFWFFPVFVGPRSVAGYRWNSRRNRWEYTGIDLNQINSFTCV